MRKKILFLILVSLLIVNARFSETPIDDLNMQTHFIQELNVDNFDQVLYTSKYLMVNFYDPDNWLSVKFAPNFMAAAHENKDSEVTFARVNIKSNASLKEKYEINQIPSLLWFANASQSFYEGCRDVESITNFVLNKDFVPETKTSSGVTCEFGFYGYPEEGHVVVLNDENFQEAVSHYEKVLVELYAPWCGHCQAQAPVYNNVAKYLKESQLYIPLIKVDAEQNPQMAKYFAVSEYPTLLWKNRDWLAYDGGHTESSMIEFIKKKLTSAVTEITKETQLEKHRKKNKVVVVYFGNNMSQIEIYGNFADTQKNMKFLKTDDEELTEKHLGNKMDTGIMIFRKFNDKYNPTQIDSFDYEILDSFIYSNRFPLVMDWGSPDSLEVFVEKYYPAIYLIFKDEKSADPKLIETFREVAEMQEGQFLFMLAYFDTDSGEDLAAYIGLKKKDCPAIRIVKSNENQEVLYYHFNATPTLENLYDFVLDYKSDKLERSYKSQSTPKRQNGAVKVLTTNTWKELVINNDLDVVVEFYDPDCDNCKQFATVLKFTAQRLFHMNNNLVFYKIHTYKNDVPGYEPDVFPTTYLFSGKDKTKKPVKYTDELNVLPFIAFLKKNRSFDEWKEPRFTEQEIKQLVAGSELSAEERENIQEEAKSHTQDIIKREQENIERQNEESLGKVDL